MVNIDFTKDEYCQIDNIECQSMPGAYSVYAVIAKRSLEGIRLRVYIGFTYRNPQIRLKEHQAKLRAGRHDNHPLQEDYNLGVGLKLYKSWVFEYREQAELGERLMITRLLKDDLCYNKLIGMNWTEKLKSERSGEKASWWGRRHSATTKLKIGGKSRGRKHTVETRRKQSKAKKGMYKGKNNPMYGKRGALAPKSKSIIIDGVTYGGYREAARALGIAHSTVTRRVKMGMYAG